MLTPDYQEFANRASTKYRDNTVICGAYASGRWQNQPIVAGLPRPNPPRKRNFSARTENKGTVCGQKLLMARVVNAIATLADGGASDRNVTELSRLSLLHVCRSLYQQCRSRGPDRRSGTCRVPTRPRSPYRSGRYAS